MRIFWRVYYMISACYGIVTVPIGPWFCRKCESPDRQTKVVSDFKCIIFRLEYFFCSSFNDTHLIWLLQRCELCPSRSGALKRADSGGWAHVVCALYIPEVRFGNVTSMEPIILQLIPPERYNKVCMRYSIYVQLKCFPFLLFYYCICMCCRLVIYVKIWGKSIEPASEHACNVTSQVFIFSFFNYLICCLDDY